MPASEQGLAASKIDWFFLLAMAALVLIGAIMMLSSSAVVGFTSFNDSYYYVKKHLLYLAMGSVAFLVGIRVHHSLYKKWALQGLALASFLILLTIIPGIGQKMGGANRWLNLGFFQFQPSELAKFFIVVFLAVSLERKQRYLKNFAKGVMPILAVIAVPALILALQPDLGNVILIMGVTLTLLLLSETKMGQFTLLGGLAGLVVVVNVLIHPYQMDRVKSFIDPWRDPAGKNYHIIQSFIAIGSGGFMGQGLGQSKLKYFYLPLQYSDFIFSIICEEGGFVLGAFVILLFAVLFHRGFHIARRANNRFSAYLAMGLTLLLVYQAYINIAVVIGVFPVKGIPLTFISFGGTSLIVSMFASGVILNISKNQGELPARTPRSKPAADAEPTPFVLRRDYDNRPT
ncbi:MAG: putative lipid II flippase FtsW [Candidatus Margulisiibacteriota bacterium]